MLLKLCSSLLGSALWATLLVDRTLVAADDSALFYAYEIGLVQDPTTGALSRTRTPIEEENFWRVCYPQNPATQRKKNEHAQSPTEKQKTRDLWRRWFHLQYIALVPGEEECPPGFLQRLDPITNEPELHFNERVARVFRRHIYDGSLIDRGYRSSHSMMWHEWSLGYHTYQDYVGLSGYDDGNCVELWGGLAPNDPGYWRKVAFRIEHNHFPEAPLNFEEQITFNTELKMGKAHDYELSRAKEGHGFVDWHLARENFPNYDLAACEDPNKPHLVLAVIDRDYLLPDRTCIRIKLTTSANQLDHIKKAWDERQLIWEKFKIPYKSPPWYSSKYELKEQGVGQPPLITRKNNPNEPITVFPDGGQPLPQAFDTRNLPPGTKVLDMDKEMVDNLVERAFGGEEVPLGGDNGGYDSSDDGSHVDRSTDEEDLPDDEGDGGGNAGMEVEDEVEDDQPGRGGVTLSSEGDDDDITEGDDNTAQAQEPPRKGYVSQFLTNMRNAVTGQRQAPAEEDIEADDESNDELEPGPQRKGPFQREDDENMHAAPRQMDFDWGTIRDQFPGDVASSEEDVDSSDTESQ